MNKLKNETVVRDRKAPMAKSLAVCFSREIVTAKSSFIEAIKGKAIRSEKYMA
jgi:hypothetical protein